MAITYSAGPIQDLIQAVNGFRDQFNSSSGNVSNLYRQLDDASDGAFANAQAEYQAKSAVTRQKFEEFVQQLTALVGQSLDAATQTDNKFAAQSA